ncbi:MAG: YihY family inner membrane protein [Nitrospiraceae bacterium]|nr:YihY family inner membrane protein [Nitrospiraceae bacterium]
MRQLFQQLIDALNRGRQFVTHDIWHIGAPGEKIPHGFIIKHVRVIILLARGVFRDDLVLRASALTFATILAIVPFLALTFFVIDTFDVGPYLGEVLKPAFPQAGEKLLDEEYVREAVAQLIFQGLGGTAPGEGEERRAGPPDAGSQLVAGNEPAGVGAPEPESTGKPAGVGASGLEPPASIDPVQWILAMAKTNKDPKTLTIAGVLFVLATVFGLMMNIERSFNRIWGLRSTRSWYRTFSDYVMVLLLLPFLLLGVVSVTALLKSSEFFPALMPFAMSIRSGQYLVCWLGFTLLYYVVPHTRVRFRYAFLAGVVAGTLWCLLSQAYVSFQFGLGGYTLLYASFAQVPVLLMWIYSSWLVLLVGAELTFAYQNERTFAMERFAEGASYAYREAVGLWAVAELGRRFDAGLPGLSAEEAASEWNVPTRLLNDTLDHLEDARLISRTASNPPTYQPSRSLDRITADDVIQCLRESGRDPSKLRTGAAFQALSAKVREAAQTSHGCTIAQLIRQTAPPSAQPSEPAPPETHTG